MTRHLIFQKRGSEALRLDLCGNVRAQRVDFLT
jgi:hypothetical protein